MNGTKPVNWGIIGPGTIARTFAGGIAHSRTGKLVAIGAIEQGMFKPKRVFVG